MAEETTGMTDSETRLMRQVALVMSQTVAAQVRLAGMQALNSERARRNEAPAYTDNDFENIILEFGLGRNTVITTLNSDS